MNDLGFTARDLFRPIGTFREQYQSLFSGREPILHQILSAFEMDGQVPVIIGDRGVGKSSVAWQVFEILRNNARVSDRYNWLTSIDYPRNAVCLWVECEQRFGTFETALLAAILPRGMRQGVSVYDLFPQIMTESISSKAKATFELNLQIFKAGVEFEETGTESDPVTDQIKRKYADLLSDPVDLVGSVLSKIRDETGSEVIIFFDEFDRLPSTSGVGDFIKHTSGVRPVIVGVGQMTRDIVSDHRSAMRKLLEIIVPTFTNDEMNEIFDRAEEAAAHSGARHKLIFEDTYRSRIIEECGGFSYLAQRIGFQTVRSTYRDLDHRDVAFDQQDYDRAVEGILSGKLSLKSADSEEDFEVYRLVGSAIGRSARRREIVAALANEGAGWCRLDRLREHLAVDALSGLDSNITSLIDGELLERNSHDQDEIRFSSPVLRLFVKMATRRNTLLGRA